MLTGSKYPKIQFTSGINEHNQWYTGSFEKGMRKDGQTREHTLLAYVLGVKHVIVAISKLDAIAVPYNKKRFEDCKAEVARYMKRVGFMPERISCVPVSALKGDNLAEPSANTPWYAAVLPFSKLNRTFFWIL